MEKVLRCYFAKKGLVSDGEFLFFSKNIIANFPFIERIGICDFHKTDFIDIFFFGEIDNEVMKKNLLKAFQLFSKSKNITNFIQFDYGYFKELNKQRPM